MVVHAPDHVASLAELDPERLALVAAAWRERARAAGAAGFGYVHALVNEGRAAGVTREHTHSQLVWLRDAPPALAGERPEGVAEVLARAELRVGERGGVVAACHPAPRLAYEVLIAPAEPEAGAFESERLPAALALLAATAAALRRLADEPAWNAWLHDGPHWHLELVPRLSVLAGVELGAGIYVSTLAPEDAAAELRAAAD